MKYLKLFEGDSYYQEIDWCEYSNIIMCNDEYELATWQIFTQKEIDTLKKRYSSFDIDLIKRSDIFSDFKIEEDGVIKINLSKPIKGEYIHIYKLEDEWFYMEVFISKKKISYYKCDQIEGVVQCIKENFSE